MIKLNTIQKKENLNNVFAVGKKGNGEAYHKYVIQKDDLINLDTLEHHVTTLASIQLQDGARNEKNSVSGVIDTDLLEIVRHRLQCFQAGKYSSEYNAKALEHIETALKWLNKRIEDRIKRNVLGTNNK